MKFHFYWLIGLGGLILISACNKPVKQEPINALTSDSAKTDEKKSNNIAIDSLNCDTFTLANTSGNFSEGQGSDKKISTEKPNRKRVLQDLTHPFQTPAEFVDETTDPAFDYSSPNECEIILADTLQ